MLPNQYEAYIPPAKLTGYLLSPTHAIGKSKAKFFTARGFSSAEATVLEQALLKIAHSTETVIEVEDTDQDAKYVIEGSLDTPLGETVLVRTVWIIETGETRPRFVTAYPV
ncbi:MAG TPA: hypothetical protein PKD98_04395 [Anaerolineae bacterium]|nr:hypothetical protein [Anaerolineae bacterium]